MPLNLMDAHFRSFAQLVLPHLIEQEIGVLGMKTFGGADGVILKSKTVEPIGTCAAGRRIDIGKAALFSW